MIRALSGGPPSAAGLQVAFQIRSLQSCGLFGNRDLRAPEDWSQAADEAVGRCKQTIQELLASPVSPQTIRLVDDVSDTVCQITDSAEFCRLAHSDAAWRSAATDACINLSGFIQELNTSKPLYEALIQAVDCFEESHVHSQGSSADDEIGAGRVDVAATEHSAEGLWVAAGLRRDFEAAGINLPADRRDAADKLTAGIERLRMLIGWNATDPAQMAALDLDHAGHAAPLGTGQIRLDQASAGYLLTHEPDAGVRKQAFDAYYRTPAANDGLMHELMSERQSLAQLMGQRSFAHHMIGSHTLAGSPEAVHAFLDDLSEMLRPQASQELNVLLRLKQSVMSDSTCQLEPEDQLYLMSRAKAADSGGQLKLTLKGSLLGLSELLQRLFGVTLRHEDLAPGEGWGPDIFKYALIHRKDELLGHVYVDAFARPDKQTQAGHYTLRCGRRRLDGTYQLPLVALSLSFGPGPLSMRGLRTLFHEFGHVLNSLLSRTDFQHYSGTRGPLDMVEVPSHVMELFLEDPRVLQLMSRYSQHAQGGSASTVPLEEAASWQRRERKFEALSLQHQIFLSRVDQRLHGKDLPEAASTAAAIADIEKPMAVFPFAASGAPVHTRFTHLVSYSSRYYSYLYAECLAATIWQQLFQADPFDQDAGDHLRHTLLESGGAKHPLQIMLSVLGSEGLSPFSNGWGPTANALQARLNQTE
ncbi:hypothetical protein WJX84_007289 [Apatococcus fuscideae]|uniref:Peptidase M3A/M3B catalytic domain-containing protein n=1 Tax=Apatococcus fuscideae TaxID=2026836 RepID=A0AAW1TFV9_9CHLO